MPASDRLWPNATTSGQTQPYTFHWRFREWKGPPIKDTYGGKAVIEGAGGPVFAELALIDVLKQHGFDGAAWVDSFRNCFRDAMPPAKCSVPAKVQEVYERIKVINGKPGGCWDLIAWNSEGVSFVECKRKGRDRMTENELRWLRSAVEGGLPLGNFAICEWEFEP